jgi:hypothetical protein
MMTDKKHYNVLIPIVELENNLTASNSFLLTIYSSTEFDPKKDAKAIQIGVDPIAIELMSCGLARAGINALGAVRKLGIYKPWFAFYQWLKPQINLHKQRLYCVGAQGAANSSSAELGLALALLMGAANNTENCVIATGSLVPTVGNDAHYDRIKDAKIYPVGSLVEKLNLIKNVAEKKQLAKNIRYCFIPETTLPHNQPVKDNPIIQKLIAELGKLGIDVIPISWLSEAANVLGAYKLRTLWQDWVLRIIIAITLFSVISWGMYLWWRDRPIEMLFLPMYNGLSYVGPSVLCPIISPQPIDYKTDQVVYDKVFTPVNINGNLVVPTRSILAWKLYFPVDRIDDFLRALGVFDGYYVIQIMLSEDSPAQVVIPLNDNQKNLTIMPGDIWVSGFQLNEVEEKNWLLLAAQRNLRFSEPEVFFSINEYERNIAKQIKTLKTKLLNTKEFVFLTKEEKILCVN